MALHELATNAVKYGALGAAGGRLSISWTVAPGEDGTPWLHIDWHETGVAMPPAGTAPLGSGEGRELIERALPYQLGAQTSFALGADGVRCRIAIPVSRRAAA
jgi:two-component sensor histidine kinase